MREEEPDAGIVAGDAGRAPRRGRFDSLWLRAVALCLWAAGVYWLHFPMWRTIYERGYQMHSGKAQFTSHFGAAVMAFDIAAFACLLFLPRFRFVKLALWTGYWVASWCVAFPVAVVIMWMF